MKIKVYIYFMLFILIFSGTALAQKEDYREVFQQAAAAAAQGDMEGAIVLYEKVLDLNPSFAPAYNNLGLIYREVGLDPVEVAWYFKSAVDIDPKYDEAYANLGRAYYVLNYFDLAERYTKKALELNPNLVQAKLSLGWIYLLGKSDPWKALGYFKEIIEASENPAAYFGLGMAYFMIGESPRTLECITKLREMDQNALALQLEELVRNFENMPKAQERPTIQDEGASGKDPVHSSTRPNLPSAPQRQTQVTVTGTIPVQLRGKLTVDPPKTEVQQPVGGVLKR